MRIIDPSGIGLRPMFEARMALLIGVIMVFSQGVIASVRESGTVMAATWGMGVAVP